MAKYYLHVHGEGFVGTGFLGAPFNTKEELRDRMIEYGSYEKDGNRYWHDTLKITVSSGDIVEAFKAAGDKSCKENGCVELFSLAASLLEDPLLRFKIFYCPGGWIKDGREFKFVLEVDGKPYFKYDTSLTMIMRSIGVEI